MFAPFVAGVSLVYLCGATTLHREIANCRSDGEASPPQDVCSIPIGQATAHHLIQVIRCNRRAKGD
jgi:hypothetical protein